MDLFAVAFLGLLGEAVLGMASKVLWRRWYRRLERRAPKVGESGVEYARRLFAASGWEYSIEKTWEGGGRCIRSQQR